VASFERMTGVDLGFVPVVRLPTAATEAAVRNAAAFTADGVVHLPVEAGPEDRSDTAALLGHELTHVMQQRALGGAADESGPLGDVLERQAQSVERALRGESVAPDQLAWPAEAGPPPTPLSWTPDTGFVTAGAPVDVPTAPGPTQRAALAGTPVGAEAGTPAADPRDGEAHGEPEPDPLPLFYPEEPVDDSLRPSGEPREAPAGVAEIADEVMARFGDRLRVAPEPPFDPRDPEVLDALAVNLYGRLRGRLRGELIADRERAGLHTEFH
jgi:hypothetical protein